MQTPIILLTGNAGVGKDTVAELIRQNDDKIISLAMADPIKRLASKMFNIPYNYLWGSSLQRSLPIEGFEVGEANDVIDRVQLDVYRLVNVIAKEDPTLYATFSPIDSLIKYVRNLKDFSRTNKVTTRYILQTLGTEWGRKQVHTDLWVLYAINTINRLLVGDCDYTSPGGTIHKDGCYYNAGVITDGRFRNEILKAKNIGCTIVNVTRSTELSSIARSTGVPGHQSEVELDTVPPYWADYTLVNQNLSETKLDVLAFLTEWKTPRTVSWSKDINLE